VNRDADPRELLFKELPNSLGIEKEIAVWDKDDLEQFEAVLKEVVDELNGYLDITTKKAVSCFAEVFDVKKETKYDVMEKIKNWYGELDASVKQSPLVGDASKLRKYADIQQSDQFEQKFLIELPKELGLKEYTKWENADEILQVYKRRLSKAKIEIEKLQKRVPPAPPEPKELSKEAESLKDSLKERIRKASIKKEEIITILEELLEEYKK
jgi:small-conductance mechanosensitive channel